MSLTTGKLLHNPMKQKRMAKPLSTDEKQSLDMDGLELLLLPDQPRGHSISSQHYRINLVGITSRGAGGNHLNADLTGDGPSGSNDRIMLSTLILSCPPYVFTFLSHVFSPVCGGRVSRCSSIGLSERVPF